MFAELRNRLDPVVYEEGLPSATHFAQDHVPDHLVREPADLGSDRNPVRGRGHDQGQVAHSRERHLQRARDRCGAQRQYLDELLDLFEPFLVRHAEAVLFVDNQQSQLAKLDVLREQAVGSDHDVESPR